MTDFTRLTIVGSVKRATIVVPSDESFGALIPRLMELLDEQVASVARPLTLLRLTGEQLDSTLSAAEQAVADGEVLRLLRLDEAPPPPEVSDVTDAVSESLGGRAGLWSAGHRTVLGAGAVGALALAAGFEALDGPGAAVQALPAILWLICTFAGLGLALAGARATSRTLLGAALGLVVPTAVIASSGFEHGTIALVVCFTLVLAWVSLLVVTGLGRRARPAALGGGAGAVGAAVAAALLIAGLPLQDAAAIVATIAIVGVGLVPWYAMSASGLTGLDDQVMTGRLAERSDVLTTVGDAYRTLTWTTFATASILAAALTGLALSSDLWALGLGAVIVLIAALRTRAFPLSAQVWALWVAVLLPVLAGVVLHLSARPGLASAALTAVAIIVALLVIAQPARHQRASLRRLGNVLESIAVIALIPLLLGSFGVYAQLLGSF
ncbi:MAG: hypothetical protein JWP75_1424 [Frondihabitans sp.]|nr:hypothetical protein [Frondihabitans sp.]